MSHLNGLDHSEEDDLPQAGRRMQEIVEKIQGIPDPATRRLLQECLESVLTFYGQGLSRILQVIEKSGTGGEKVHAALLGDGGVAGLLLIHGLHPVPIETRLLEALDKVRPYMKSHGGDVELLSLEHDFAKLRLQGHCETCPSSTVTLELAVRHAIEEACPDLAGFEVDGVLKNPSENGTQQFKHVPSAAPQWLEIENAHDLAHNQLMIIHEGNEPLILCRVADQFYAYFDRCPGCNMPLHLGTLQDDGFTCQLGHRYDIRHAGRGLHGNPLHLEPLPLLVQNNVVKVALSPTVKSQNSVEDRA